MFYGLTVPDLIILAGYFTIVIAAGVVASRFEAPERGEFAMVAIMPPGRKLLINAVTKRAGEIRVQIDGVAGRSLDDCDPIVGDQYRKAVTWKGRSDIGQDEQKPMQIGEDVVVKAPTGPTAAPMASLSPSRLWNACGRSPSRWVLKDVGSLNRAGF
jgi:hypothetical protein